jgi:hypothetical protein
MVLQFHVPPSQTNCTLVMPPPEDQFPATLAGSQSSGIGADWSVFTTGTNTLGQTALDAWAHTGSFHRARSPRAAPRR